MTSSDIRTLTISSVSMLVKEQNLFGSPHYGATLFGQLFYANELQGQ